MNPWGERNLSFLNNTREQIILKLNKKSCMITF